MACQLALLPGKCWQLSGNPHADHKHVHPGTKIGLRLQEGVTEMGGKERQTARKPATKFAHLRKKMEKAKIGAKIAKKR